MSDLIERQKAIELIHSLYPSAPIMRRNRERWKEKYAPYIEAEKALEKLPSAQPEIIRCRDCIYWREHKYAKETKRYIPFCGFNAIYTKSDDFCSKAERRTDEQT